MKLIGLACAALVLFASSLAAQTVTRTLAWDQPGVVLTDVGGLTYTLVVDTAAPVILVPACLQPATVVQCTAPISLTAAPHTLTLTVTNAFGSIAAPPLVGVPPGLPANVKVKVTVTVP